MQDLHQVIGLFPHCPNFNWDINVEQTGTPSPPPTIGLLRSLMLRVRASLTILMAVRSAPISRAPTVSVPSGV